MTCQEERLGKMNEAQREAVTHGEGPLLLLAGPGSGKTFTITNRILYLLEQGNPAEAILVITFTKEAALSMQNRFHKMASSEGNLFHPVNFGTFHSVFYHILQESNVLKSGRLLKQSEKKTLLYPILQNYGKKTESVEGSGGNQYEAFAEDARQMLAAISFYKNTMCFSSAADKAPVKWRQCFEEIYYQYESGVKKTGRIDFDDMLYECRKLLLENKAVRKYWQSRFRHILMDEFQDINPVQYEVVKLLAAKPYNLFAVGDDDQAIYGFRGSEPECLKRFQDEFRARQLLLDINYRSKPQIVQASLAVIGENRNRFEKKLRAAGQSEPSEAMKREGDALPVALRVFGVKEEEYAYLLEVLAAQADAGESRAVLFRTNSYMQGFAARLKAAGIPYEMKEKAVSIYEHFIVADIMAYLQLAAGEGKREQMLRIMNRPSRYISREAVGEGAVDLKAVRAYYGRASLPQRQRESVLNALAQLERQLSGVRKLSPLPAVNYILKAVGYERYLKELAGGSQGKWQEWRELLEWFKEDAARFQGYKEWKNFQEEYGRDMEEGRPQDNGPIAEKANGFGGRGQGEGKAVQLLTVHASKGLEFDKVWIPDCNEKNFPHGKMPDEKSVEEERRIFYVAMTRAKKSLELLSLIGTKERPRQPSRFLNPLMQNDCRQCAAVVIESNARQ